MTARTTLWTCLASTGAVLAATLAAGILPGSETPAARAATPPTAAVAPLLPAQAGGQYGTIKGRLVWGGSDLPKIAPAVKAGDKSVKDAAVCAKDELKNRALDVDPASKGIAHAFAYLASPKGANAEAEKALVEKAPVVEIDQVSCEFLPYSTAMHEDQLITFKSSDPVGHNIRYTGFVNGSKNIALAPNGALKDNKLKAERRPMPINCDIHPWMKGWVMIFDHPFFAVTKPDGTFEITGVPAGTQNLVLWLEPAGYVTEGNNKGKPIKVEAGKVTDVGDIVLPPAKVAGKVK